MQARRENENLKLDCRVHVPDFEGPLDLMLHLVKTHELDLENLSISKITEQYLRYLDYMRELNLDLASEYLVMAATLTYLKSQVIVPAEKVDEETGPDPRQRLIRRLIELKCYKELSEDLANRPRLYRDVFVCRNTGLEDVESTKDPEVALSNPYQLLESYRDLITKKTKVTHNVYEDKVPVSGCIQNILERLRYLHKFKFSSLFPKVSTVPHMVANFLGVLEMAKLQMLNVKQDEIFGPIEIERKASTKEIAEFEESIQNQLSWD